MKTICYNNYDTTRNDLINNTYYLSFDSIGQLSFDNYCIDITVRQYDELICIDYDIYKKENDKTKYLDGGKVCNIKDLPLTEEEFWELVENRINIRS